MTTRWMLVTVIAIGCGSSHKSPASPPGSGHVDASPTTPAPPAPTPPPKPVAKTLYDRLGGQPAITAVVEEFVDRTTTDPRIKFRFINTDATNLKKLLVEFVCMATGGPCKYSGREMDRAHAGMDLVDDEFTALVENLKAALDKFKVPAAEENALLGALGPLKPQIVVTADRLKPIADADLAKITKLSAGLKDKGAAELLDAAVVAGKHGQRNYAEQLFTRAEMIVGAKAVASAAPVFRKGAPPRITTTPKAVPKDSAPQPATVGRSDDDEPDKKPQLGKLTGVVQLDGKPMSGFSVVMLTPKSGGAKKRVAKQRVIEQRDRAFAPHVMAMPTGSTVSFPNFDTIFHNVFSLSKSKQFDLGMYKSGETREVMFDKPGIVRIGCNIHASMAAYLVIVDAPHYAVAGADGSFSFGSLAPGAYKVQAWSERSAVPSESELTIKAGANTATIQVGGGATAGVATDKFGGTR